jgi:glucuronokinase
MSSADPARHDARATGRASARAALAGNPSDGYGGAVLAVTVDALEALAVVRGNTGPGVEPESQLVQATVRRFAEHLCPEAAQTYATWSTTIPRSVGLGGSSAIVIATLRALCGLHRVSLSELELAEFALAVEVQELDIAAGPQDRIAQAYGGLTFMDFGAGHYERLERRTLPPLVLAWRTDAATESGQVHTPLRERHARGEVAVVEALRELGRLAREARAALASDDMAALARCVDASFDARQRIMALDERHVEMIHRAREHGAAANYAGSGGAIIAVCPVGADQQAAVAHELRAIGCGLLTP